MKAWFYLLLAISFEVCGTTSMKLSQGFTRLVPSIAMFACYLVSLGLLTLALRGIDLSIAYAVWAGLGTALVSIAGVVLFREGLSALKIVSLALVIAGVVGLKLASDPPR